MHPFPGVSLATWADSLQSSAWPVALALTLLFLLVMIASWIASKAVSVDRGSLANTLKVIVSYLVCTAIVAVVIRLALGIVSGHDTLQLIAYVAITVAVLVYFWAIFIIPMALFRLQLSGVLGYMTVAGLLIAGGATGLHFLFGRPFEMRLFDLSKGWAAHAITWVQPPKIAALSTTPTPTPIPVDTEYAQVEQRAGDRSKSIDERHAALLDLFSRLEATRMALHPGDAAAAKLYEQRRQRYEKLLANLQADNAAAGARP